MASKANPLPFSETLRDLALLRASDIDFSSLLPASEVASNESSPATKASSDTGSQSVEESVQRSYEFVHEARAALKILYRNEVEREGMRVDDVRSKIEDVLRGMETEEKTG
ncbi:hypothetical protein BXZ70DRAFT_368876 [Cristinia sonorae]|uniref:Uncharacterized protein n=1 Tax=Cristinia sonorae TaxID=1940300 RepID=A0A8K0XMK8_9AGAR|nr:hypothetical protein BXZ70DRAFT_368876 [Cristinia sonorae]